MGFGWRKAGLPTLSRGALRGGDAKGMQDTINAFESAGTTPSVGQASQWGPSQLLESFLAKMPGSAGVMAKKAKGEGRDIGAQMTRSTPTAEHRSDRWLVPRSRKASPETVDFWIVSSSSRRSCTTRLTSICRMARKAQRLASRRRFRCSTSSPSRFRAPRT